MPEPLHPKRALSGAGMILALVFLVYANTFEASWHLDDYSNIVDNPKIHLTDLYPRSLARTFRAAPDPPGGTENRIYRPVAMLSFGLNWYAGGNGVAGYHLVNLAIHATAALFLFFTVHALLMTPKAAVDDPDLRYQAALLAALLWAIHPIQIQAVTYIVQRMASLAGMFYIAGLFFFLKARLSRSKTAAILFTAACPAAFALALGSKENAILLPLSWCLVELTFFRDTPLKRIMRFRPAVCALLVLLCLSLAAFFITGRDPASLLGTFENRSFSQMERLMTEARVVCRYLYQLVLPLPNQFSIDHGVRISKGLLEPWTTLACTGILTALLAAGIGLIRKHPVKGFALVFFFLNHGVESTILDLEPIFEHRNYIPSLFFFVPFALGMTRLLNANRGNRDKRGLSLAAVVLLFFTLCILTAGTHSRNKDWKTEKSLWESAVATAPDNARPYQNLASFYYQKEGQWGMALLLHEKALLLHDSKPDFAKMVSYDNMRYCYARLGDWENAADCAQKAVDAYPTRQVISNHIHTLIQAGRMEAAARAMTPFLSRHHAFTVREMNIRTTFFLKTRQPEKAVKSALEAFRLSPFEADATANFGLAGLLNRQFSGADHYLNKAIAQGYRHPVLLYLCLIQNSLNREDQTKASFYARTLVKKYSLEKSLGVLKETCGGSYPLADLESRRITRELTDVVAGLAQEAVSGLSFPKGL